MWTTGSGTKIILEDPDGKILTCLRDNRPDIPYPNKWDLPGGGVEQGESLLECAYRELREEFGLNNVELSMLDVLPSKVQSDRMLGRAFGRLSVAQVAQIEFSGEGQAYAFFLPEEIAELDFVDQLQEYVVAHYGLIRTRSLANS